MIAFLRSVTKLVVADCLVRSVYCPGHWHGIVKDEFLIIQIHLCPSLVAEVC